MRTQRKERSRRQRGAVLVEAVIVIATLLLLWMGGRFFYVLSTAQLDAFYASRQEAWERTMSGCDDAPLLDAGAIFKQALTYHNGYEGQFFQLGQDPVGYWENQMQTLIELLGGEDVHSTTKTMEAKGGREGAARIGMEAVTDVEKRTASVLMGCNERPHDLGTRSTLIQWVREIIFH